MGLLYNSLLEEEHHLYNFFPHTLSLSVPLQVRHTNQSSHLQFFLAIFLFLMTTFFRSTVRSTRFGQAFCVVRLIVFYIISIAPVIE